MLARVGQDVRNGRSWCIGFDRMALSSLSSSIISGDSAVRNVAGYPFSKHFVIKLDIFYKSSAVTDIYCDPIPNS